MKQEVVDVVLRERTVFFRTARNGAPRLPICDVYVASLLHILGNMVLVRLRAKVVQFLLHGATGPDVVDKSLDVVICKCSVVLVEPVPLSSLT